MAWDRLKLMIALVVVAFLALLVLMNRRDPGRAPSERRRAFLGWSASGTKAGLVLGAVVSVGLVVLVNHLGGGATNGDERIKLEYSDLCTDEQGRSVPAPWAGLKGEGRFIGIVRGDRTIFQDANGKEISCPSPRVGG